MKNSLIVRFSAVTALTFTALTLHAAEPLLSPRALAQRSQPSTGVTADRLDRAAFATPKAATWPARPASTAAASRNIPRSRNAPPRIESRLPGP
jgi:hypothetical protein